MRKGFDAGADVAGSLLELGKIWAPGDGLMAPLLSMYKLLAARFSFENRRPIASDPGANRDGSLAISADGDGSGWLAINAISPGWPTIELSRIEPCHGAGPGPKSGPGEAKPWMPGRLCLSLALVPSFILPSAGAPSGRSGDDDFDANDCSNGLCSNLSEVGTALKLFDAIVLNLICGGYVTKRLSAKCTPERCPSVVNGDGGANWSVEYSFNPIKVFTNPCNCCLKAQMLQ